jgi:5-methylcytosine-specific restriction endonuclease McrA
MLRIADISFDESDRNLFQVDDPRLRADALKHSILPRLHVLHNECVSLIKQVYDIDAFDDSIVSFFPHFRVKRQQELKLLYNEAFVSLGGKRTKDKWHGVERTDGKPAQILPFRFALFLSANGLGIELENYWLNGLTDASYRKFLQFHLDFEALTDSLCYECRLTPRLYYGKTVEPISPFRAHYEFMMQTRAFDNWFVTVRPSKYPVFGDILQRIAQKYAIFYPVYDSYIQISKGEPIRFEELIAKANRWLRSLDDDNAHKTEQNVSPAIDIQKARESAEQRVKVMPALRWQVFQRDNWRCVSCGRGSADEVILHADHIIPRSRGGQDTLANYQTLCHLCNLGKSNKDDTDLRQRVG